VSFGSPSNRVVLQKVFVLTGLSLCRDVWTQSHLMLHTNNMWMVTKKELMWSHSAISSDPSLPDR